MKIDTIYPDHGLIKKHIAFFYFFKNEDPLYESSYYVFPHLLKSLNIHTSADCSIDRQSIHVFENPGKTNIAILQGKYEKPVLVKLSGRLDKVTIIFKPLGLNHFISEDFNQVAADHSQVFASWEKSENYKIMLQRFYGTDKLEERAALLEDFLISQYHPLPEYEMLQSIMKELTNYESQLSLQDIASAHFMSEKTLNRLFKKHLAFNPSAYRKIAKFRHSLTNKLYNDQLNNLTNVSYNSNYYDPSYFNRIYNKLTGENPKAFFDSIAKLSNDQMVFRFVRGMK